MSTFPFHYEDRIFQNFIERQYAEGTALSDESDILDLHVSAAAPPHFVADFHCKGLIRNAAGKMEEANEFRVAIWYPPDSVRRPASTFEMFRMLTPCVWHPNVAPELPLICVGNITAGNSLVDLIHRLYEVITYQRWNPVEHDSLNRAACSWARRHQEMFPLERNALRRQRLSLQVEPV
jgi:hypothetical protein